MLGMRTWLRDITGGTAVLVSEFKEMRPAAPRPPRTRNGVLVSNQAGIANPTDLLAKSKTGSIFIDGGTEVYQGMIFGESYKDKDVDTNISHVYKPIVGQ